MPDNDQASKIDLTRRKILAASGAIGASGAGAGLGANALFSDQEQFANNQIEAGELDLKVDWQVDYYNGLPPDPTTISTSDTDDDGEPDLVDEPGPIVDLQDVKPGDVIEHTLSLHLFGNPGFITMDGLLTADSDNGFTEPEDQVDGILDNSDGTSDGDLDDHLQCVVWFDDGDGLPQEIWNTSYSQTEEFIDDLIDGNVSFDTNAEEFLFQGTLASLMSTLSGGLLLDPRVNGHVANDYPNSFCFQPSITEYLGILCWLPRDIPGVDDNIVQSDRLKYELGFNTNQCRNNIANDGRPVQRPVGGVQPLRFEVTEGYGTLGGGPVDLRSDVGFPENMVTSVDTSGDPVEFVLDVPQGLDKTAGDQWSLVFDADSDGTVDFRVVFDEFFYQEWDESNGEWGPEQPVPTAFETAIIDGIYIVRIPRDRLAPQFSVGGRVCYGEELNGEDLCVSLTPDLVPQEELGPGTSGFEPIVLQDDIPIPTNQLTKLTPDVVDGSNFGNTVALDNDTALIGAPFDDNPKGDEAGSAYVFVQTDGDWNLQQKLSAPDGDDGDNFGESVALDDDTAVIGAEYDEDPNEPATPPEPSGSAYVFVRSEKSWFLQQKLIAPDGGDVGDLFGSAAGLDGDIAVTGARDDSDIDSGAGAAYAFFRENGTWNREQTLSAPDAEAGDSFGNSVSVSGDTALIGAFLDGYLKGSAYVFVRGANGWALQQKLTAPDGGDVDDLFGSATALDDDTALIGAVGSAYVFGRDGGTWPIEQDLVGDDGDAFGSAVALDRDTAVIGAENDGDPNGLLAGSAYVFKQSDGSWSMEQKLAADDGDEFDAFGSAVALDGDIALIGAVFDEDLGPSTGSAYVFGP